MLKAFIACTSDDVVNTSPFSMPSSMSFSAASIPLVPSMYISRKMTAGFSAADVYSFSIASALLNSFTVTTAPFSLA